MQRHSQCVFYMCCLFRVITLWSQTLMNIASNFVSHKYFECIFCRLASILVTFFFQPRQTLLHNLNCQEHEFNSLAILKDAYLLYLLEKNFAQHRSLSFPADDIFGASVGRMAQSQDTSGWSGPRMAHSTTGFQREWIKHFNSTTSFLKGRLQ